MNNYINNYNFFTKKLVFQFEYGMGGIGDYLKFFTYIYNYCIKNNIKLFLSIDHPLNKYIRLKYDIMYVNINDIKNYKYINSREELENLDDNIYYIIKPFVLYNIDNIVKDICNKWILNDIFFFTNDILYECNNINDYKQYISIHLRLGDKFLETDNNFIICKEDIRFYNQNDLENFIEKNIERKIYFFCDNNNFKQMLKNKYPYINITNFKIGHTSLLNTTEEETKNSIIEFCLLSQSSEIYGASYSGFSFMASRFNNIKYTQI